MRPNKQVTLHRRYTRVRDMSKEPKTYEGRLSESLSRTRRIFYDLVMNNDFALFFTITIDENNMDRFSFDDIMTKLSTFFKNYRNREDKSFKYIFVPERHEDGAWHVHGFMTVPYGLYTPLQVEIRLGGILKLVPNTRHHVRWDAISERFGHFNAQFVSGGEYEKKAEYCISYISKAYKNADFKYKHLIYRSHRLERPERVYEGDTGYSKAPTVSNQFCSVAWLSDEEVQTVTHSWAYPGWDEYVHAMSWYEWQLQQMALQLPEVEQLAMYG